MHRVIHLETHIAHGCNLTCESCTHFSQDGHSGRCTPEQFEEEIGPWSRRLVPNDLLLLGGEPLLNPQVERILVLSRTMWPRPTRIHLVTNGLLLHKFPNIHTVLTNEAIVLNVSIHHDAPEYLVKMAEVKALTDSWGIPVRYRPSHRDWTRAYKGTGKDVMPYTDGDQRKSWKACVSKWCMNIHEGMLYKCPPIAYLPMQDAKFGIDHVWTPYLAYKPLAPDAPEAELLSFIGRTDEHVCTMCPANPEHFVKPNPMRRS